MKAITESQPQREGRERERERERETERATRRTEVEVVPIHPHIQVVRHAGRHVVPVESRHCAELRVRCLDGRVDLAQAWLALRKWRPRIDCGAC